MLAPDPETVQKYYDRLAIVEKMDAALRTPLGRAAAWSYSSVPLLLWNAHRLGKGHNVFAVTLDANSYRVLLALEKGEKVELSLYKQCDMIRLSYAYQQQYLKNGLIQKIPAKLIISGEENLIAVKFIDRRTWRQLKLSRERALRPKVPRRKPRKL